MKNSEPVYILGLQNDEDSGVCLMRDGELLEAISEERLSRTKMQSGFPRLSMQYVLDRHGLTPDDLNYIAYGWYAKKTDYTEYAKRLTARIVDALETDPGCGQIIRERVTAEIDRDEETRREFLKEIDELGIGRDKIYFVDHHASHVYSAFSCSPFDRALVFTFDGRGDLKSATVSLAEHGSELKELDYMLSFDSLGFLYGQITGYMGYTPHRHEGKVTGLAAHGDASKTLPLFEKMIGWKNNRFFANLGFYKPFYTNQSKELKKALDRHSREDIAAGVQAHCENLVRKYVAHWVKQVEGPIDVCLAGGVCANVRINQEIAEIDGVREIFVFPHMGDGGLPVGAACGVEKEVFGRDKVAFNHVYHGPEFDRSAMEEALFAEEKKVKITEPDEPVEAAIDDLEEKKVIGFFEGRMEYGPRALGARSILVHTKDPSINDWLNKRLQRTEYMPFAPVVPEEFAADCFTGWKPGDPCSPYMTRTYHCTPEFRENHPAVVHIDNTARPQTVTKQRNGKYYELVRGYCDRTGSRALVNTSFNQHEEPIVCSPEDAVGSLLNDNVDVLYMGPFRAVRK